MTVPIAPRGAVPILWILKDGVLDHPDLWRSAVHLDGYNQYVLSEEDSRNTGDQCAACFLSLANETPVFRASCKRWFHVNCIQEIVRMMTDECPLCLREGVFHVFTALAGELNFYNALLSVPSHMTKLVLALGVLLSPDGRYDNPTKIAACRTLVLDYPCILSREEGTK